MEQTVRLEFNAIGAEYRETQDVSVDRNCNGWTAINEGDEVVRVNGIPLKPYPPGHPELSGESVSIGGNKGEFYRGKLQVQFAGGGSAPLVVIIQKFYLPAV